MTKSAMFVVALLTATVGVWAAPIEVVNYSFELPGTGKPDFSTIPAWDSAGNNLGGAETEWGPTHGVYTGYMQIGCQAYNLTNHTIGLAMEYTLTFDMRKTWDGANTTVDLYYDNGGVRVPMASLLVVFPAGSTTPMQTYTLKAKSNDVPASIGKKIGIQITCGTAGVTGSGWIGLDYFRLDGVAKVTSAVSPADGATLVDIDANPTWSVLNGWRVDLYFRAADPNFAGVLPVLTDTALTSHEPGALLNDTMYYWRADAYEPNSVGTGFILHKGDVWSFRTTPATPVVTVDPASQTVPGGSTVVLTVEGKNIISVKWFKNSVQITGVTGTSLTLPNVTVADEGNYHCEILNSVGSDSSPPARLMIRRLVGWWKLDNNLEDSVASVVAGAPVHNGAMTMGGDATYVVGGIDGGGVEFTGTANVVAITGSEEYFNFYPLGQTVSGWVKSNTGGWDGVISKHLREGTWAGWVIDVTGGWAHFTLRGSHDDLWGSDNDGWIFDEGWHLLTAVMDPASGTSRFYVDGAVRGESGAYNVGAALLSQQPLVFGAEAADGEIPYVGMLDDVRVWNYALDNITIAQLYTDFNPGSEVCIGLPMFDISGPDGNSDCRVDLNDLAAVASEWLECNIVPTCIP